MWPEIQVVHLSHLDFAPGCGVRIREAGRLTSFDGCRYRLGNYACWHVIARGSGTVRNECGTFSPRRGDMFSILPGGEVEYFDDPAAPWKHMENGDEAIRTFQSIWQELFREENRIPSRMASRLFHLLTVVSGKSIPPPRTPEALAEQALCLLNDPIHSGINVNELAGALCVSRTTLHHAFRKRFGRSPIELVTEIRMERAKSLLRENPGLTPEEAAGRAAFENVKYFIRAFRKHCGITPGKFRDKTK